MFQIGQFSRLTRVPVTALRYWADRGLLPPAYVDPETGYRFFAADQLPLVNRLLVLKDLGLSKIRLLTNNSKKTDAFIYGGYDLEVIDQVPILGPIHEHNERYMTTKRDKMGHKLP